MMFRKMIGLGLALGVAAMLAARADGGSLTFDNADALKGLTVSGDVKNFNWNQSKLKGFVSVVFFGDATDAGQTLCVDDVDVALGPPARVAPVWPPPPPTPPADLAVLPAQAPWNSTPYAQWKNGPGKGEDYFPIAVWLQDPKNARATRPPASISTSDCGKARPRHKSSRSRGQHARDLRPERLRSGTPGRAALRRLDARR